MDDELKPSLAILGTAGIPAAYGGFETLAENLVLHHQRHQSPYQLSVYCSSKNHSNRSESQELDAKLCYIPLSANGISSIPYDVLSLFLAVFRGTDLVLLLGVSGAIALPFIRLLSNIRIVTNVDGVEWKRQKWKGVSKWWLKTSEALAVRFSHEVIVDNQAIAEYVAQRYRRPCRLIPYGGNHAVDAKATPSPELSLPARYALALCRIEPENNVLMILETFARPGSPSLVFIGNWNNSGFGRKLREKFSGTPNMFLLDPIYDPGILKFVRQGCDLYVHGHSAGGTNPSLVEMMHFGLPIVAYDCAFNRYTTEGNAFYFNDGDELHALVTSASVLQDSARGEKMRNIAEQRYTWTAIGESYFELFDALLPRRPRNDFPA